MLNELLKQVHVVQQLDSQMLQLRHKLVQLDPGKQAQAARDKAAAELTECEEAFKKLHAELTDAELELKAVEDKKKKHQKRLFDGTIHNPRELDNTRKEVEALDHQREGLDERILGMWDAIEEKKHVVATAKERLTAAEEVLAAKRKVYAGKRAEIEKAYRALHVQRQKLAEKCDQSIMKKYEIIRTRHDGLAISPAKEGICTACGSPLPVTSVKAMHDESGLVTCDSCSRLVFLEE
jgi:uncharacterized protein